MKQIIIGILVFISTFFIINRVHAASYTMPITNYFLNYYDESHNLKNDLDNILNIAKNKDYEVVITLFHYSNDDNYNYCNTLVGQGKCKYIYSYNILVIKNGYVPTFKINSNGWVYSSTSSNIVGTKIYVDSNYVSSYNALIQALNESDFSGFSPNFNASTGSGKQWYYQASNDNQMIYGASEDYEITSLDSSSNNYFFGDNQIMAGSLLPTYKNYYDRYTDKGSIEFNSNISSFDIYVDKDDELVDLKYKLNYIDYNDYTSNNISKAKLYGVMFYGLKNENGLYHWEMLDDCTNWDYPSEYCHVKSKVEQLEAELDKDGYTISGHIDFLDIFNEYETVRIVVRLDNALSGKIDYLDMNSQISGVDVDVNYFGFDYSRNLSDSNLYRYTIFTTKEKEITDNLYIISENKDISIDYFDTKYASFKERSYDKTTVKKIENAYVFNYKKIGLNNNLGFYFYNEKTATEELVYLFYIKPGLYFSYNDSDTLDNSIYINNAGDSVNTNIAINPEELMDYSYDNVDALFENVKKFNDKIEEASQEIHSLIQYAYDNLNIYIKAFLISIFTVILVSATITLIRM